MSAKGEGKKKESKPAAGGAGGNEEKKNEKKQQKTKGEVTTSTPTTAATTVPTPAVVSNEKQQTGAAVGNKFGIKRNIRPDSAARDAELELIATEFAKVKAERDEVGRKMKEVREASKGGNDERQKVRQELNKIKDELQKIRAEKDAVVNQQKAAVAALEQKYGEERKSKESLGKLTSVEAIEEEIQKIEKRMTSGNFSSKEEKDMIREMDKLRLSKKNVGALKQKADEVQKAKDMKKEIDAELNQKRAAVDEVQKRFQTVRDALTALDEKDKEGVGAIMPKLRENHDALNKKLDDLIAKRQAVYDEWKKKMKEWQDAEAERRKLELERRAAEQEKRRLEQEEQQRIFEEKRKLKEEEEAKKKPWESEIALCDYLISYLQRLSLKNSPVSPASGSATSAAAPAPTRGGTDFGALKPLQRNQDDDYINLGAKKANKTAAPKPAAEKKAAALAHSVDTINSFGLVSLIPPSTEAGIEASIAELKAKRAYYDVLPRAPKAAPVEVSNTTEKKPEASPSQPVEARKSSKKSERSGDAPPSVQDSSLFPHLPGSKPALDASDAGKQKWGPKPSESGATSPSAEEEEQQEGVAVDDE
jgi:uncharacterized coiled-coil DUF342 family protein